MNIKGYFLSLILVLFFFRTKAEIDSLSKYRFYHVNISNGLLKPNLISPPSEKLPFIIDASYSILKVSSQAYDNCNCFYKYGIFLNYTNFKNPASLGSSSSFGTFFEPILFSNTGLLISLQARFGLTYLSKVYDSSNNPSNIYFSLPISSIIGTNLHVGYKFNNNLFIDANIQYNHISNSGLKLPNHGMNIPSIGIGFSYVNDAFDLKKNHAYINRKSKNSKTFLRIALLGGFRVLPADNKGPEMTKYMWGNTLIGGYRFTRSHAISLGFEWIDDRYFKEQLRRWGAWRYNHHQGTILGGYELWQGKFTLTAHFGWNIIRPGAVIFKAGGYKPYTYQRYALLYNFRNGITMGIGVKSYIDATKGFNVLFGYTL